MENNQNQKHIKFVVNKLPLISLIVSGSLALLTILFIILSCTTNVSIALPIIFGVLSILAGVGIVVLYHLTKKQYCPECQIKYVDEITYLGSSKEVEEHEEGDQSYVKHIYTHHYSKLTYCPLCHKEEKTEFTKPGGEVIKYKNGQVVDNRIVPDDYETKEDK